MHDNQEIESMKIGVLWDQRRFNMIRQGDILVIPIKELPKNLKEKDNIVAYGEASGHFHKLEGKAKVMISSNGQQYAILEEPSVLTHQEHENITIPSGMFKVIQQRECDIIEGVRQVMD